MTLIHDRVAAARRGENPTVVTKLRSGWVVMGDTQFLPGYCLLLPDPVVDHLTDLDDADRSQFLGDMALVGEALHAETDCVRVNYEILGNGDAALHAHIFARYESEPIERRQGPVWFYPDELRVAHPFDQEVHGELQGRLRTYIEARSH